MALNENAKDDYRAERKERLAKAAKKSKKSRDAVAIVRGVLIAILVVIVLASTCGGLYVYGIPQRYITALSVGDRDYSIAEYNYYYTSVYQTYAYQAQTYESSYGFSIGFEYDQSPADQVQATETIEEETDAANVNSDTTDSAAAEAKTRDITYDEYFRNYIIDTLEQTNYYLNLAKDAGMTLSDEHKSAIDDNIQEIADACESSGYSIDRYISLLYGKGMNEKILRSLLEDQYLASQYQEQEQDEIKANISDEAIEEKYNEDPSSYQKVDIRLFGLEIETDSDTGESNAEVQENLAKEMLGKITDEASFTTLSKEYAAEDDKEKFDDDTATLLKGVEKSTVNSNIDEDLATWLYDSARITGDKTTCTTDSYVYVIYVIKPVYREETPLRSARHILISFENVQSSMESAGESTDATNETSATATDGSVITNDTSDYSMAVVLEAYEQAKAIYDEYMAGEQTEDAFAALANENSADTSSTEDDAGGLYEDIELGQMVSPFENWVYDDARETGDVGLVESTYGWHVMYFVSKNDEAEWKTNIREDLAETQITEKSEEIKEQVDGTATTTAFTKLAGNMALKFVENNYVSRYASQDSSES